MLLTRQKRAESNTQSATRVGRIHMLMKSAFLRSHPLYHPVSISVIYSPGELKKAGNRVWQDGLVTYYTINQRVRKGRVGNMGGCVKS